MSDLPAEALRAALDAVPCTCDVRQTWGGVVHKVGCSWLSVSPQLIERILRAAAPHLLAAEVSAHVAEQDAVHADLALLLRTLGLNDGARPQSPHEVMLEAVNEAGRIREALATLRAAVEEVLSEEWGQPGEAAARILRRAMGEIR